LTTALHDSAHGHEHPHTLSPEAKVDGLLDAVKALGDALAVFGEQWVVVRVQLLLLLALLLSVRAAPLDRTHKEHGEYARLKKRVEG